MKWAIVEVMGHRRYAGQVEEVTLAGAAFIQVTTPDCKRTNTEYDWDDNGRRRTREVIVEFAPLVVALGAAAIFAVTWCTEAEATEAIASAATMRGPERLRVEGEWQYPDAPQLETREDEDRDSADDWTDDEAGGDLEDQAERALANLTDPGREGPCPTCGRKECVWHITGERSREPRAANPDADLQPPRDGAVDFEDACSCKAALFGRVVERARGPHHEQMCLLWAEVKPALDEFNREVLAPQLGEMLGDRGPYLGVVTDGGEEMLARATGQADDLDAPTVQLSPPANLAVARDRGLLGAEGPCPHPGCIRIAQAGWTYCEEHARW